MKIRAAARATIRIMPMAAGAFACLAALVAVASGTGPPLRCPTGTHQEWKATSPGHDETWCALPDGTRQGPYRQTWPAGHAEGAYQRGQKEGVWRTFSGERLVSEYHYRAGVEDGPLRGWDQRGVLQVVGRNRRGEQHGLWRWWHPNGRRKGHGVFVDGRAEGRHVEWDEQGHLVRDGRYRRGREEGRWFETHLFVTAAGSYRDGQREGRWVFRDSDGKRAQGAYHAGKKHGPWTSFWDQGEVRARGAFRNGRRNGRWLLEMSDGRPGKMVDCRDGAPHGQLRVWGENGKVLLLSGEYRDGQMHGPWQEGTPPDVRRGNYRNGRLVEGEHIDVSLGFGAPEGDTGRWLCENDDEEDRYLGEDDRVAEDE